MLAMAAEPRRCRTAGVVQATFGHVASTAAAGAGHGRSHGTAAPGPRSPAASHGGSGQTEAGGPGQPDAGVMEEIGLTVFFSPSSLI